MIVNMPSRLQRLTHYIFKTALWGHHWLSQSPGKLHVSGLGLARQTVGVRTGGRGWSRSAQAVWWFEYLLYNFLVLWQHIADGSMDGDRHMQTRVHDEKRERHLWKAINELYLCDCVCLLLPVPHFMIMGINSKKAVCFSHLLDMYLNGAAV